MEESQSTSTNIQNSIRDETNESVPSAEPAGPGGKKPKSQIHYQPNDFILEDTTVWSFRNRGRWATHSSEYRGNWSPRVVRNLILRYSSESETVLDPFVGGGTTLIETKLLNRNGIGFDINEMAVKLTIKNLDFESPNRNEGIKQTVEVGDARNLSQIGNNSMDLILLHPPYADIIEYTKDPADFSMIHNIGQFLSAMKLVANEMHRILKDGRHCALLIGDTRRFKHYVPIAFRLMDVFLGSGFILKENIIKHQWNCKSTPFWREKSIQNNFLLLMHEHLFVFRKPDKGEDTAKYRESMI